MSIPQCPLYRPVGRNPRMTSPDTGQANPAHDGAVIDVASRTAAINEVTLLHRHHRTNNLPDDGTRVKGHVWAPAADLVLVGIRSDVRTVPAVFRSERTSATRSHHGAYRPSQSPRNHLGEDDQIVSVDGGTACDRRVTAEDLAQRGTGETCKALSDQATRLVMDLHGITPGELTLHTDDTGSEEGSSVVDEGCNSTVINNEDTERREAECNPEPPRSKARGPWFHPRSYVFAGHGLSDRL